MTELELQRLIECELGPGSSDAAEFAADIARLAAIGLVDVARTVSGEVTVGVADGEPQPISW